MVDELVGSWYGVLSSFTRLFAEPIKALSDGAGIPPLSAGCASTGGCWARWR